MQFFIFFNPLFSWIFQNVNALYLLLSMKPLIYAGLSQGVAYSVFNSLFRSEKVFACACRARATKKHASA
jgi:hypothetical protein